MNRSCKVNRRVIKQHKTRGNPDNLELNHVGNISRYCRFVHSMHDKGLSNEELTILYFNHITALVTCLETYHRDLIILVLNQNQSLRDKVFCELSSDSKHDEPSLQIASIIDSKCHLQDLPGIKESFRQMLGIDYIEIAQNPISPCAFSGKFYNQYSILDIHPNWLGILQRLYEELHNVIHDANYISYQGTDWLFLNDAESVAIVLPQFLLFHCIYKFMKGRGIIVMSDGEKKAPAIWGISETISTDWKVVD